MVHVTFHGKTYTNGYPFKRPKPFTCRSPAVQTATVIRSQKVFSRSRTDGSVHKNSSAVRTAEPSVHKKSKAVRTAEPSVHKKSKAVRTAEPSVHKKSTAVRERHILSQTIMLVRSRTAHECTFFWWFYSVVNRQKGVQFSFKEPPNILFFELCCFRMKLDTLEGFWLPNT